MEIRNWQSVRGASYCALNELILAAPRPLPSTYLSFLSRSNGGEGPLCAQPYWLCMYSAEEAAEVVTKGVYQEFFPGLFAIGQSGGGEVVAFDFGTGSAERLVYFDACNIDLGESVVPLAKSFDELVTLLKD